MTEPATGLGSWDAESVPQPGSADTLGTSVSSEPGWRESTCRSAPESSGAGKYTEQAKQSIFLQIPATHKQVTNQLLIYSPSLADRGLVGRYEPGQVGPANQSDPMFLFFLIKTYLY